MGPNQAKQCHTGPNEAKWGQTAQHWANWAQIGQTWTKWGRPDLIGTDQKQPEPNPKILAVLTGRCHDQEGTDFISLRAQFGLDHLILYESHIT